MKIVDVSKPSFVTVITDEEEFSLHRRYSAGCWAYCYRDEWDIVQNPDEVSALEAAYQEYLTTHTGD